MSYRDPEPLSQFKKRFSRLCAVISVKPSIKSMQNFDLSSTYEDHSVTPFYGSGSGLINNAPTSRRTDIASINQWDFFSNAETLQW
jgi:hypothetical protein